MTDSYKNRQAGCVFCEIPDNQKVAENELAFGISDIYPVTPGHTLIIPKRHVRGYFDLYQPELNAIRRLLQEMRASILGSDKAVTGFNVGSNDGSDAGQTVMHCHIHLIPRRQGDLADPRGGVRGVIPEKRIY